MLEAAVALADEIGLEGFSMRGLAQRLGVVPMALYKHVANKDELLDGMVDIVFGEMEFAFQRRGLAVGAAAAGRSRRARRSSATAGRSD